MIPQAIIDKAPTAELRPNQKDQDSLPPYPILDEVLTGLIEDELSVAEIVAQRAGPLRPGAGQARRAAGAARRIQAPAGGARASS